MHARNVDGLGMKPNSNFCFSEPPPRLPFSGSGVVLESVARAVVAVGGGR